MQKGPCKLNYQLNVRAFVLSESSAQLMQAGSYSNSRRYVPKTTATIFRQFFGKYRPQELCKHALHFSSSSPIRSQLISFAYQFTWIGPQWAQATTAPHRMYKGQQNGDYVGDVMKERLIENCYSVEHRRRCQVSCDFALSWSWRVERRKYRAKLCYDYGHFTNSRKSRCLQIHPKR